MATSSTAGMGEIGRHRRRRALCLAIAGVLALSITLPARAAPTATQILTFKPRQEGVPYATPETERQADCKVELIKGRAKGSGWLLRDPDGKPLRLFFDTNDDNKIDIWSYYKDGVEVFREIDS